jgi:TRAP-type C4-dicarboxylate transport system permease small subunit
VNSILRTLTKFDHLVVKGEAVVLIALVMVLTMVVFLQVVYRYVLTQPLHWSEELARYLFVWLSIFGATLGLQKRGHFGFDIFFQMLPKKGRHYVQLLINLLIGVVIFVIFFHGITLVKKTILQESPAMGIPMGWVYASLPAGAALMGLHLIVIFLKDTANKKCEMSEFGRSK